MQGAKELRQKTIFDQQKKSCLAGIDLSRKGSVDSAITGLVTFINQQPGFFTTSSCSGRIAVYAYPKGEVIKKGCEWLMISHTSCSTDQVTASLTDCNGDAYLKFEAFVLHVQCATLTHAQMLLACAVASGYRNSGISVGNKSKVIVAVRSSHGLEVPLSHLGKVMVNKQYVDYLVDLANQKMVENLQRIQRIEDSGNERKPEKSRHKQRKKLLKPAVCTDQTVHCSKHQSQSELEPQVTNNLEQVGQNTDSDCKDCSETTFHLNSTRSESLEQWHDGFSDSLALLEAFPENG